jgi:hypothetical protein
MARTCITHGRAKHVYKILVEKYEWERPVGRFRHRREDNIKTYLNDLGCEGVDWIQVAQCSLRL